MTIETWLAFVATSAILVIIPALLIGAGLATATARATQG